MRPRKTILAVFILVSFACLGFMASDDKDVKLETIAREYKGYTQYIDSPRYNWTVLLCSYPPRKADSDRYYQHHRYDGLFISDADGQQSPHGNRLYKLYVKDANAYYRTPGDQQPEGQVIVKETWNVQEIMYDSNNKTIPQLQSRNDGKWYTPVSVSQLFIMYKEKKSRKNDKGWVYGIVDIENKQDKPVVLDKGNISTCIKCHKGTKYDRIFGAL